MKKYLYLYFVLITSYAYCQQSYSFESKIHPEKEYILQMNISSINETTIVKNVTKSDNLTKVTRITTTEKMNKDGLFPASMRFENLTSTGNGKEIINPLSNTIIVGQLTEDNKFKIDTIYNSKIDQKTRVALKSVFKDLKPDIDFPNKPLNIGDSFENKIPMIIPFGGQKIKTLIIKNYKLKSVIKNIALFEVTEKISLNMDSATITASGEGAGLVEFNISENQIIKDTSHYSINMNMKTDVDTINGFVQSNSEKTTTIKDIIIEEPPR